MRRQRLHRGIKQRGQCIAIVPGNGIGNRRQRGNYRADRERGAPLVVDRGDDAILLQLQLLFEREPRQRALLNDRKGPENPACYRHGQRNGQNQTG